MPIKLTKIESNHSNCTQDVYYGNAEAVPTKGEPFAIFYTRDGRERCVITTRVVSIKSTLVNNYAIWKFKTMNSTYEAQEISQKEFQESVNTKRAEL